MRRAREQVPFYRYLPPPSEARDAEQAIEETLAAIPVLEKNAYRDNTSDLLAQDIARARLRRGMTSGTTGSALRLFHTAETLAEEYATVWRLRQMEGVQIGDPHMTFGGQIIVPYGQTKPPFWRRNSYSRQTIFSLYHMTPSNLEHYVDAIHQTDAVYVTGYPSAICLVARAMLSGGRPLPRGRLKAVFTSSESLLAFHRESIERAFGAPVRDRYGSAEFAVSMTACAESNLHVDMEFCIVEVEPQEETEDYVRGNLLVTGLSNDATPFLRYRIGDQGTRLKGPCPCGRPGDVFLDIDGRAEDFIMTPDGRLVGRLDHIFKTLTQIEEAQIRQESKEAIQVLFVPAPDFSDATRTALMKEIRRRLGQEILVDLRPVKRIAREANGKFRAVKSEVGRNAP